MKNMQIAVLSAKQLESAFCLLAEAFRKTTKQVERFSTYKYGIQKNRSKYHN